MDQYDYIRTAHRFYVKRIKEIARETGHSKNTIKRMLRGEHRGYGRRLKQPYPILGLTSRPLINALRRIKRRVKSSYTQRFASIIV